MQYSEVFDPNRSHWDWLAQPLGLAVALLVFGLVIVAVMGMFK